VPAWRRCGRHAEGYPQMEFRAASTGWSPSMVAGTAADQGGCMTAGTNHPVQVTEDSSAVWRRIGELMVEAQSRTDARFDRFEAAVDAKFERFQTAVEARFVGFASAVDARFSRLEGDVAGLKTDVAGLKTDVAGLKTDVAGLKVGLAETKEQLNSLERSTMQRFDRVDAQFERLFGLIQRNEKKER
jgi:hypothetical protein